MKINPTVGTIAFLAILWGAVFLQQGRVQTWLRADNVRLRKQSNRLAELSKAREENQGLRMRQADAAELERSRAEQASLRGLQEEADRLRRELAQRTAPRKETSSAMDPANSWDIGQTLSRAEWNESGQATLTAALKTYLSAIREDDLPRLKRCAQLLAPPGYTNDFYAWELKYRQDEWKLAQSVQLIAESRHQADQSEVQVEFNFQTDPAHATAEALPTQRAPEKFSLIRVEDQWKVALDVPPQVIEVRLSEDPQQRARQIAEMPAALADMLKSAPSGRKLTIRRFGLPGPPPGGG